MKQQLNAITIAAKDLAKLKKFYCTVFKWTILAENESIVMFKLGSVVLSICDENLFKSYSANTSDGLNSKGVYLTINLPSPNEVDENLQALEAAGSRIVKAAEATFWGGYSGFAADPENNVWEICYNPIPGTRA